MVLSRLPILMNGWSYESAGRRLGGPARSIRKNRGQNIRTLAFESIAVRQTKMLVIKHLFALAKTEHSPVQPDIYCLTRTVISACGPDFGFTLKSGSAAAERMT